MDSARGSRAGSFREWVQELTSRLGERPGLAWTRVEVVEVPLTGNAGFVADRPRRTVEDFEQRWAQILGWLDRDWVNLAAYGVDADALVVGVEWSGIPGTEPAGGDREVSVNLSGAAGPFVWPWA